MDEEKRKLKLPLTVPIKETNTLRITGSSWESGRSVVVKVAFQSDTLVFIETRMIVIPENGSFEVKIIRPAEIPKYMSFGIHIVAAYGKSEVPSEAGVVLDEQFKFTA